ncbi:hypothetical protein E3C22_19735 [Jiella endophytica]|uniref:Uncharacterized protein n=1 Tax=Jiella endophytica TaxID=2558362 RepID=A0A4Y8RDT1_9HYPH|nr:AsmA-like C-terminal region-containing protein [Jiella endophytica]TFF19892.1 hypothetical protein E3C22_19735 [Jiella endophytica]
MRRRWLTVALAAVVTLVVVFAAILPGLALGSDTARALVVDRLEALTGRHVSIDGRIEFSVLPRARLSLEHVRLGDDDATIDNLVANFSLFDVIAGDGDISRLVLVRPEWRVAGDTAEASAIAAGTGNGLLNGVHTLLSRMDGIRAVEIRDGLFRPAGPGFAGPRGISNANIQIAQSASTDTLSLSGGFVWNGQPSTVDLEINADAPLKNGGNSNVDVSIDSPALAANFSGTVHLDDFREAHGRLSISAQSFTRAIEWLFAPGIRVPELGVVDLAGDLFLEGDSAELREASLRLGASEGRGAMEARLDGDLPVVGGTLAFNDLNLTPIARSIAPYPRNALDFERPLAIDFAKAMQMEIRLSASELMLGSVPFQDVAAVVSVGGGIAKLDVGDAAMFGGRGQAAITVDGRNGEPTVEGWISASGLDTASMMQDLAIGSISLTGRSSVRAKLDAPASNWRAVLTGLRIEANFDARNGQIAGFDPRVFAEPGARPLVAGTGSGSIPFTTLDAKMAVAGTDLDLDKVTIRNDAGLLTASGRYFAKTNEVDVTGDFEAGEAQVAEASGVSPQAQRVGFKMKGEWPNPNVTTAPSLSQ